MTTNGTCSECHECLKLGAREASEIFIFVLLALVIAFGLFIVIKTVRGARRVKFDMRRQSDINSRREDFPVLPPDPDQLRLYYTDDTTTQLMGRHSVTSAISAGYDTLYEKIPQSYIPAIDEEPEDCAELQLTRSTVHGSAGDDYSAHRGSFVHRRSGVRTDSVSSANEVSNMFKMMFMPEAFKNEETAGGAGDYVESDVASTSGHKQKTRRISKLVRHYSPFDTINRVRTTIPSSRNSLEVHNEYEASSQSGSFRSTSSRSKKLSEPVRLVETFSPFRSLEADPQQRDDRSRKVSEPIALPSASASRKTSRETPASLRLKSVPPKKRSHGHRATVTAASAMSSWPEDATSGGRGGILRKDSVSAEMLKARQRRRVGVSFHAASSGDDDEDAASAASVGQSPPYNNGVGMHPMPTPNRAPLRPSLSGTSNEL